MKRNECDFKTTFKGCEMFMCLTKYLPSELVVSEINTITICFNSIVETFVFLS